MYQFCFSMPLILTYFDFKKGYYKEIHFGFNEVIYRNGSIDFFSPKHLNNHTLKKKL